MNIRLSAHEESGLIYQPHRLQLSGLMDEIEAQNTELHRENSDACLCDMESLEFMDECAHADLNQLG